MPEFFCITRVPSRPLTRPPTAVTQAASCCPPCCEPPAGAAPPPPPPPRPPTPRSRALYTKRTSASANWCAPAPPRPAPPRPAPPRPAPPRPAPPRRAHPPASPPCVCRAAGRARLGRRRQERLPLQVPPPGHRLPLGAHLGAALPRPARLHALLLPRRGGHPVPAPRPGGAAGHLAGRGGPQAAAVLDAQRARPRGRVAGAAVHRVADRLRGVGGGARGSGMPQGEPPAGSSA
jgi:hypothetical protein